MMTQRLTALNVWKRNTRKHAWLVWFAWLITIAAFIVTWRIMNQNTLWFFLADAPEQIRDLGGRMFPPSWSYINSLWGPLWDTLNIATLGTLIGIVIAVPIAFLAARNTTPSRRFVRPLALLVIVASRSINSLIWALLLVVLACNYRPH
ncbi:PhnE/PtxC family ABC transporter permease [Marinobacter sp. LV10R520-4]|uniref:PhnE/PtxC family ABC transporter permease n=1 Tax=Marinobacter sp. LV10R520-4 TaxID=1761796 RepID=UPI001E445EF1|nr:hypothetical protein [Marinobacter sp. LV10R520-4]